jgi:hypothetical protein
MNQINNSVQSEVFYHRKIEYSVTKIYVQSLPITNHCLTKAIEIAYGIWIDTKQDFHECF